MRTSFPLGAALPMLVFALAAAGAIGVDTPIAAQAGARERTLFVSAVDSKREPIEGLGPNDFVIREDGVRREVLRVSRAIEPIDVALLIDNSAASTDIIPPLRDGLKGFIAALVPQNSVAIVGLADRPTIMVDYTTDQTQLMNAVGRLFTQSNSGMTLLDAIVDTSAGLEKRDSERAVIIPVISDGQEFSNRYFRDVIAAMTKAGAGFHALTVGTFALFGDDAVRNRAYVLEEGTRVTGGQRITLLSPSAVGQALQKLARELQSQYKVVYSRPDSLIPPSKTEVSASRAGVTMRGTSPRVRKTGA